jgi:hypothetical protein
MVAQPGNRFEMPTLVTTLAESVREEHHMAMGSTPPKLSLCGHKTSMRYCRQLDTPLSDT